jgi:hypothetical protein
MIDEIVDLWVINALPLSDKCWASTPNRFSRSLTRLRGFAPEVVDFAGGER